MHWLLYQYVDNFYLCSQFPVWYFSEVEHLFNACCLWFLSGDVENAFQKDQVPAECCGWVVLCPGQRSHFPSLVPGHRAGGHVPVWDGGLGWVWKRHSVQARASCQTPHACLLLPARAFSKSWHFISASAMSAHVTSQSNSFSFWVSDWPCCMSTLRYFHN